MFRAAVHSPPSSKRRSWVQVEDDACWRDERSFVPTTEYFLFLVTRQSHVAVPSGMFWLALLPVEVVGLADGMGDQVII